MTKYQHPWYTHIKKEAKPPRPATKEAIKKAQFKDKTFVWTGN